MYGRGVARLLLRGRTFGLDVADPDASAAHHLDHPPSDHMYMQQLFPCTFFFCDSIDRSRAELISPLLPVEAVSKIS